MTGLSPRPTGPTSSSRPHAPPGAAGPPSRPVRPPRILIAASLIYVSILGFLYAHVPPNPDQSIFNYIAWIWVGGGLPYRDALDVNFPGAMILHALAYLLFGNHLWSYRLLDFLNLIGFVTVVAMSLSRRQGRGVALVFAVLYPTMYVVAEYWFAGQRDILAAHLVLVSGLAFLERIDGGRVAWCIAAGALIWLAMLIKPTYAPSLPMLLAIDFALRRRSGRRFGRMLADQCVIATTMATLVGITFASGWAAGVVDEWYDGSILFVFEVYSHHAGIEAVFDRLFLLFRKSWHWYSVYAVCGGVLWWRSGDRPTLLVVLGTLVVTLVSVFWQRKGFGYHFGGILTVLAILMANFLARLIACCSDVRARPAARLVAVALLMVAALGLSSKLKLSFGKQVQWHLGLISRCVYLDQYFLCVPVQAGEFVRSHTDPDTPILTFSNSYDMIIHTVAERKNLVRFAPSVLVDMARPPFRNASRWHQEFEDAFHAHPPKYVITYGLAEPSTRPHRFLDRSLRSDYTKVRSWDAGYGVYDCFERKSPTTAGRPMNE